MNDKVERANKIRKRYKVIHEKKWNFFLLFLSVLFGLGVGLFSSGLAALFPQGTFIQVVIGALIVAISLQQLNAKFWKPLTEEQTRFEKEYKILSKGQAGIRSDI